MSNKRLYKSTVNCMLCGVCGGIAEYFDIDPTGPPGLGNPDLLRRRRNLGIYIAAILFRKHKKNCTRSTACENLAAGGRAA